MQEVMKQEGKEPLLKVSHLKKYFKVSGKGMLHAVDDVSFDVYPGETLGLVGESGCGKSTVGNVLMQLHDKTDGEVLLNGKDLYGANKKEICRQMQIIFQDPYSSLNPRQTIRTILSEAYLIQKICKKGPELDQKLLELCEAIGLAPELLDRYPHELDGGMRQVVGIGRALSLNPSFIVCDEPVSSLDVSVQAKIINMLMRLQRERGISYLFISHDLSVVRHISNRICVMYLGQVVEMADADTIFANTLHPYSIALLSAVPKVSDTKVSRIVLKGDVPSPMNPKPGCRFAPRCWMACPDCAERDPEFQEVEPNHYVRCFHYDRSREEMKHAETTGIIE